jgi:hypothetical protein
MQIGKHDECNMIKLTELAILGPAQAVEAMAGYTAGKVDETKSKDIYKVKEKTSGSINEVVSRLRG